MANELDELLGMVTGDDKTAMEQILARNPVAKERAEAQAALFAALATGDNAAIANATTRFTQPATPAAQQAAAAAQAASATAATSLDDLTRMVSTQVSTALTSGGYMKREEAEALATTKAEELFKAKSAELLATSAQTSDQIYTIRRSHEKEFGNELDTAKFTTYLNENPGKFTSLAAAHDSYVGEERIQARIAKGIAEAQAANASTVTLPGTTLSSAANQSPLANMMRENEKRMGVSNGAARGEGIDAAVVAWRALQAKNASQAN